MVYIPLNNKKGKYEMKGNLQDREGTIMRCGLLKTYEEGKENFQFINQGFLVL
jgi:hypothetical protein